MPSDDTKTAQGAVPEVTNVPEAVEALSIGKVDKEADAIAALPPAPAGLAGSSTASGNNYQLTVSNKAGYLCHVHVVAEWPVGPEVPFAIFTHPDNSALFRDVKRVGERKVLKMEPGYKEVQVEQLGEVQVLWMHRTYSTWLHVVEDTRDPECLRIIFSLVRSDVLGKFSGEWELRPVRNHATGHVTGCRGELRQDVLPKGMPAFMARLPVLGAALRGISVRAITRVMEDFNVTLAKVLVGHAAGRSTEAVLRELCGPVSEAAHANGAVTSFAFDAAEDDEEDEGECQTQKERGAEGSTDADTAAVAAAVAMLPASYVQPTPEAPASEGSQAEAAESPVQGKDEKAVPGVCSEGAPVAPTVVSARPEAAQGGAGFIHVVAEAVTATAAST